LERSGEEHRPEKFGDFRKVLESIEKHPNRRYFIFKSIIINNLYGVDIMEEAIEICKLRLFLKLVAQVEKAENIEPLPDIDFNIHAGNTLVGYATYDEVKKAVLGDTQGKLDLGKDMERIDEKAQDVDRLFKLFRDQQTELGGEVTPADKQELRNRLRALEDELNRYLAGEYGIDPDKKTSYEKWLVSHKPFHWFIEFYGIVHRRGGFSVIIGNPPFVEYNKVKKEYTIRGYETEACGNLYAFVMERSISLLGQKSFFGLISPHSLAATYRSNPIQKFLLVRINGAYSFFSRRPGKLFEGADQCLCISIGSTKSPLPSREMHNISTTYQRWYTEERDYLFKNIKYISVDLLRYWQLLHVYPKLGEKIEYNILEKISRDKPLRNFLLNSGAEFYCHRISRYFIKSTNFIPYFCSERDGVKRSDDFKVYFVATASDASLVVAALNSSLFYWFWRVMFDGYHCGKDNIGEFPFEITRVDTKLIDPLKGVVRKLMVDFRTNSERKKVQYKGSGVVEYDEFYVKKSKAIIDEIDYLLANHFGFTVNELDFIMNYDIKYRMGLGGEETEEGDN